MLILALALAGVTYFVIKPKPVATGPGPIVWLASLAQGDSAIESMRVEWSGGEACEITRSATGDWVLRSGKDREPWPIGPGQLRGALRLLAEHANAERATGTFKPGGAKVTLRTRERGEQHVEFSPETLGGRGRARIDSPEAPVVLVVDAQVRDLFTREGLLAWRKGNAFPREGMDPTRITVETPGGKYTLGSVQGQWALQRPVVAPASKVQVTRLKERLGTLTFTRIVDGNVDDSVYGFESPWGVVGLETPMRGEGDTRQVLVEALRVGNAADVAGTTRFVRASARTFNTQSRREETLWGPIVAVIDVAKLDALAVAGNSLISKRSTPISMADVGTVELTPLGDFDAPPGASPTPSAKELVKFTLGVGGWERVHGGRTTALSSEQSAEVAGFVKMLADTDAAEVSSQAAKGVVAIARVNIQGRGASDSTVVLIGALPGNAGNEPALITRIGGVDRIYRGPWVGGLAQWLAKVVEPEG